ncbi:hypothetical protein PAMC26510_32075 [Caballeronia sordidicola]|uniref:Uncharacterized protein n=1 Tax=Caballeronia sordidicola TaxID=196367 RepID=A0A242M784_CABSO|nr:hypothetical protein PAMC26510_32075 [Caballeronia sordidicola]
MMIFSLYFCAVRRFFIPAGFAFRDASDGINLKPDYWPAPKQFVPVVCFSLFQH